MLLHALMHVVVFAGMTDLGASYRVHCMSADVF